MLKSGQQKTLSLQDILEDLKIADPSEYYEVRFIAGKIVDFFRQPPHEITVTSIKKGLRFFPLFLSFERLSLDRIEIALSEVDRLISAAKAIEKARLTQKPAFYREEVVEANANDDRVQPREAGRRRAFSGNQAIRGGSALLGANCTSANNTIAQRMPRQ